MFEKDLGAPKEVLPSLDSKGCIACAYARSALKPDAQPLAALAAPHQALGAAAMRLALQRLAALMDCLERLLGQPAPCPVPVPGAALLALCARALSVDDGLVGPGGAFCARRMSWCQLS